MIRTPSRVESPRVQFSKNVSFKTLHKLRTFDIYSHLRSNRASPTEVSELIEDLRHEVEEYDQEIGRLYSAIFALQNKKKELLVYEKKLKWFLSPVRKLPKEIVSEIFGHCILPSCLQKNRLRRLVNTFSVIILRINSIFRVHDSVPINFLPSSLALT
jgi:hypothetical protein